LNGEEEEDHGLPEDPYEYSFHQRPTLIFLLCEEDGLGEVSSVEVAEKPVMIVVSVPPHLKGELHVHSNNVPEDLVHLDALEKGEVSHVVKLYEKPDQVEEVEGPPQYSLFVTDQRQGNDLDDYIYA